MPEPLLHAVPGRVPDLEGVTVRAPAKINLVLAVEDLRADGFHELSTVYQAVSLHDHVTAAPSDDPDPERVLLTVTGEGADEVPLDDRNLAVRAVRALAAHLGRPAGVRLHVDKAIPVAAGLAGGSADAAGALLACDTLWGSCLGVAGLAVVAARLGSDVPFSLHGGTALGTGRGENLLEVMAPGQWSWVLGLAHGGLSTPTVYAALDADRDGGLAERRPDTDAVLVALRGHDPQVLARALGNSLSAPACRLRPGLAEVLTHALELGALAAQVSGSGPTVMLLASDPHHAGVLAAGLGSSGLVRRAVVVSGPVPGATVLGGARA